MEGKGLSVEAGSHQCQYHRIRPDQGNHLDASGMGQVDDQSARVGHARCPGLRHQPHVLALQACAEVFHQVEVAGVVLVEFDEFDVIDGVVHTNATQYTTRGSGVLYNKMFQSFHDFKRSGGDDLFGLGGAKEVGHQE